MSAWEELVKLWEVIKQSPDLLNLFVFACVGLALLAVVLRQRHSPLFKPALFMVGCVLLVGGLIAAGSRV